MTYKELLSQIQELSEIEPQILDQEVSVLVTHEDEVYPVNSVFISSPYCDHCESSNGVGSLEYGSLIIETRI